MTKIMMPTFHRVKIKPFKEEAVVAGNIEIPEAFRKLQARGEILAVGKGTAEEPMFFKPGQIVIFPEAGNSKIIENGEQLVFCSQYDIVSYEVDAE